MQAPLPRDRFIYFVNNLKKQYLDLLGQVPSDSPMYEELTNTVSRFESELQGVARKWSQKRVQVPNICTHCK
jgi:hypothetical protein